MALPVRALLWVAVVLAPGGVVLLPVLGADALRRRQRARGGEKPKPKRRLTAELAERA